MLATRPRIIQSQTDRQTGGHATATKVNLIANVKLIFLLKYLHFSLDRFGTETCGGGEIGNIKTKNGRYLFPVVRKTN